MEQLDGNGLQEVLDSEFRNVLVDFWSPWCAPCHTLKPHLNKFAEERPTWRFVGVNTEEHPEVVEKYGVRSLPTLVFLKRGEELHRFSGPTLVSSIEKQLDSLG